MKHRVCCTHFALDLTSIFNTDRAAETSTFGHDMLTYLGEVTMLFFFLHKVWVRSSDGRIRGH